MDEPTSRRRSRRHARSDATTVDDSRAQDATGAGDTSHRDARRRRRRRAPAPKPPPLLPRIPWRRLFGALALGVLALVLVGLVVVLTVDVERYKPDVVAAISAATGREFAIDGAIRIRPSLSPTLVVEDVRLANPPWARERDFLRVERVEASVRLGALLRHRIEIVRFDLRGAAFTFERDGGRASWHFAAAPGAGAPRAVLPTLAVERVRLLDVNLLFPHSSGVSRTVHLREITLDAPAPGEPLRLRGAASYDLQRIDFAGRLGPLEALHGEAPYPFDLRVNFRDLRLEAEGSIAAPARGQGFDVAFSLEAPTLDSLDAVLGRRLPRLSRPRLSGRLQDTEGAVVFDPLSLELGPTVASGRIALRSHGPRLHLDADITAPYLDLDVLGRMPAGTTDDRSVDWRGQALAPRWLDAADLALDVRIDALRGRNLELDNIAFKLSLDDRLLAVEDFVLALGDGRARGRLRLDARSTPPQLTHELDLRAVPITPLVGARGRGAVRGGHLDLALEVAGSGADLGTFAGQATGRLHAHIRDLELDDRAASVAEGDLLLGLLAAVNPHATQDDRIEIECAVAHFPLRACRFENATGLGVTTRRLRILGGGTVELASGALDLGIDALPRPRVDAEIERAAGKLDRPTAEDTQSPRGDAQTGGVLEAARAQREVR
ncbi:MAG: AsmA family protein, partial [Gammaproteobacteria bacterium]